MSEYADSFYEQSPKNDLRIWGEPVYNYNQPFKKNVMNYNRYKKPLFGNFFGTKNMSPWQIYFIIALMIVVIYKGYKWLKSANLTGAAIAKDIQSSVQVSGIREALNANGISDVRAQFVQTAADDIYSAFYKDSFWGMGEDEEKAINAFNSLVSVGEAKACAALYSTNFKKNLAADLYRYCNGDHWSSVKQSFYNAIK